MSMEIKNRVTIVTGGASGLGEATVRNIILNGGKAVILDLDAIKGAKLSEELGDRVLFIETNIINEDEVDLALKKVKAKFGDVNILVNCAGIGIVERTMSKEKPHDLKTFSKVIEVNLIGTFNVIRLVAEMMSKTSYEAEERGVIINTASIAAFEGQTGQAAYSASKGGIVGMTLPIARDLSVLGIRVMTIAPGMFDTPINTVLPEKARKALRENTLFPKRLGFTNEYAHLVQSIIENPMLNGEVIRLDGASRLQP